MLPVEILISEHRIIEQMVEVLKTRNRKIFADGRVDPNFIVTTVDFFRTYADRYHHGKEEGILFNALSTKKLSDEDAKIMRELIMEHAQARKTVKNLEQQKENYIAGNTDQPNNVCQLLDVLVDLYPKHIEKEDKHFFYPAMTYFTEPEQADMLEKFMKFDKTFTSKRYKQIIDILQ